MGVSDKSDWLYAKHAALALAETSDRRDDLYVHYGHFARTPEAPIDEAAFRAAQRALDDQVIALARIEDGMRVVDVGCGIGGTIGRLDQTHERMELHGVNVDPVQIEAARARVDAREGNRIRWHVADALALPFETASIDRMLAVEALPHFGSRERFFAEAARVMRDGAILALSDFVPTKGLAAARDTGRLPNGFVDALVGLGPFEDFWGEGEDLAVLAERASLKLVERVDATQATLPTYSYMLRDTEERALLASPLPERGIAALGWAQRRGLVRMEYVAFRRQLG